MKYSTDHPPLVCMMTQSTCYRESGPMAVRGVLWHSTGADNPWLKRYVQPSDGDPDRERLLRIIGVNRNGNDWNHIRRTAGVNCWIGKLADGEAAAVQTLPWDWRPWGCGSGRKGSCNSGWVQFEICEDDLENRAYFETVYREACEITAYLCRMFRIDPRGTVRRNGVDIPTILCHKDSADLGFGSDHADVLHWFSRFGKTMAMVRADVARLLRGEDETVTYEQWKEYMDRYRRELGELPAAEWARPYIQEAVSRGLMDSAGGSIARPVDFVSRQELAKVAALAAGAGQ